jgi:hypothetical protein
VLLAQADRFRRDLDEFVVLDELQLLFRRDAERGREVWVPASLWVRKVQIQEQWSETTVRC